MWVYPDLFLSINFYHCLPLSIIAYGYLLLSIVVYPGLSFFLSPFESTQQINFRPKNSFLVSPTTLFPSCDIPSWNHQYFCVYFCMYCWLYLWAKISYCLYQYWKYIESQLEQWWLQIGLIWANEDQTWYAIMPRPVDQKDYTHYVSGHCWALRVLHSRARACTKNCCFVPQSTSTTAFVQLYSH